MGHSLLRGQRLLHSLTGSTGIVEDGLFHALDAPFICCALWTKASSAVGEWKLTNGWKYWRIWWMNGLIDGLVGGRMDGERKKRDVYMNGWID